MSKKKRASLLHANMFTHLKDSNRDAAFNWLAEVSLTAKIPILKTLEPDCPPGELGQMVEVGAGDRVGNLRFMVDDLPDQMWNLPHEDSMAAHTYVPARQLALQYLAVPEVYQSSRALVRRRGKRKVDTEGDAARVGNRIVTQKSPEAAKRAADQRFASPRIVEDQLVRPPRAGFTGTDSEDQPTHLRRRIGDAVSSSGSEDEVAVNDRDAHDAEVEDDSEEEAPEDEVAVNDAPASVRESDNQIYERMKATFMAEPGSRWTSAASYRIWNDAKTENAKNMARIRLRQTTSAHFGLVTRFSDVSSDEKR